MRFFTYEFVLYYFVIALLLFGYIFNELRNFDSVCLQNSKCNRRLEQGWMVDGWLVDNDDTQLRDFRKNIPILFGLFIIHTSIGKFIVYILPTNDKKIGRKFWNLFISIISLSYVFGSAVLWPIIFSVPNYVCSMYLTRLNLAQFTKSRYLGVAMIWILNILGLFIAEFPSNITFTNVFGSWFSAFDGDAYKGIIRWYTVYNLVVLKMTSWSFDCLWAHQSNDMKVSLNEKHTCENEETVIIGGSYKDREKNHLPLNMYNFVNYLTYLFYIPTLMAGPIISANAFLSQIAYPQRTYSSRYIVTYFLRWCFALLLLEVILHRVYIFAIMSSGAFASLSYKQIIPMMFGTINVLWLKFLVIWRFFRLWALVDGIETVENMNRCVCNNYTISGFWQSWHRSFNRWLIRYIYIPLGGNRVSFQFQILNIAVIFTYVAWWHDMTMRLLAWGWIIVLAFLPEILCKQVLFRYLDQTWYWRHLASIGGAFNIVALMSGNIVGFGIGTSGIEVYLNKLLKEALFYVIPCFFGLFCAVQIMVEIRVYEVAKKNKSS